jgi:hypothetical protein
MKRATWRWIAAVSIVLALLTTLPYLVAYARQGDEWAFTGFVFGVEDGNSYIAKMNSGLEGAWLFRTPYTTEYQSGVIAQMPYLLLGKLAGGDGLHTQLVALFHMFRVLSIPVLVVAAYRLIGRFLADEYWRRWAVVVSIAGGGLGWVLLLFDLPGPLQGPPLEFYSPESFGFLAVYGIPHLVMGRALLLLAMHQYLGAVDRPLNAWYAGLLVLLLGLFQPISMVTGYGLIGMHQVLLALRAGLSGHMKGWKPGFWTAARTLLVPAPLVLYNMWAFSRDPYLRLWAEQNVIRSPAPEHYLLSFSLLLIPATLGIWAAWRKEGASPLLLVAWVAVFPILAYFPHNLQRRLPEGIWVAITALAAMGMAKWVSDRGWRTGFSVGMAGVSLLSSLVLVIGGLGAANNPARPVFRPIEEVRAYRWLAANGQAGDVVLASYATGNALPAWVPMRVLVGHGPESAHLDQLAARVQAFYAGQMSPAERGAFLAAHGVDWIFWGPQEREGGGLDPNRSPNWPMAYQSGSYAIWRAESSDG